jgi:hypothetical protein
MTDGFREYMTALLTHYGQWAHLLRNFSLGGGSGLSLHDG